MRAVETACGCHHEPEQQSIAGFLLERPNRRRQLCLLHESRCHHKRLKPLPRLAPMMTDEEAARIVLPPWRYSPNAGQDGFLVEAEVTIERAAQRYLESKVGAADGSGRFACGCTLLHGTSDLAAVCDSHRGALLGRDPDTGHVHVNELHQPAAASPIPGRLTPL